MNVSLSPSGNVMHNHVTTGAKETIAWHISPFGFSRFAQVVSRPKARPTVLSVVLSGYLGRDLGGAMPRHHIAQHFTPALMLS